MYVCPLQKERPSSVAASFRSSSSRPTVQTKQIAYLLLADAHSAFQAKYEREQLIGLGSSAEVFKVTEKGTGKKYACKIISLENNKMNDSKTMRTEIAILQQSKHNNIVDLHEVFETNQKAWLILELVQGGNLVAALSGMSVYTERMIARLFHQLLLGVQHLHEQGVVHRDLKAENILCEREIVNEGEEVERLTVKITDFGLSALSAKHSNSGRKASKRAKHLQEMWGTEEYFAPEVYQKAYGAQADVWSLGCVLFEMLTGQLAFPHRELSVSFAERLFLHGLSKPKRTFERRAEWPALSAEARSLIKGMLKRNPVRRLDIAACLQHPWILNADVKAEPSIDSYRSAIGAVRERAKSLEAYDRELQEAQERMRDRALRYEKRTANYFHYYLLKPC
jgi:serine/threonine protein kinase